MRGGDEEKRWEGGRGQGMRGVIAVETIVIITAETIGINSSPVQSHWARTVGPWTP